MKKVVILIIHVFLAFSINGQEVIKALPFAKKPEKIFVGLVENRQNQFEVLQQERDKVVKAKLDNEAALANLIHDTKNEIGVVNKKSEHSPENDFLKQKLLLLNDSYQVFKDLKREREKTIGVLDDLLKQLQEFLQDPEGSSFIREQKLTERPYYSFEDLQRINASILDQEKRISTFQDQEKHLKTELENRKRAAATTVQAFKNKQEQSSSSKITNLDAHQVKEVSELEERFYTYKKTLDEIRITEIGFKIELIELELSMARSHLTLLKDYLRSIKPAVRVSEADIIYAKEEFGKATNKSRIVKEQYRSEIDHLVALQDRVEDEIEDLSRKYNIAVGREISEWTKDVQPNVEYYTAVVELGALQTRLHTYQKKQELLDTQIDLEDEKLREIELLLQIKESYHKKFNTEEEVTQELKNFEMPKIEADARLAQFKEKISSVADQINNQKKIFDNIQTFKQKIHNQKDTTFKHHGADYMRLLDLLRRADVLEKDQIDILSKLTGAYSGLTSIMNNKLRMINFIVNELESRTIWHRPDWAISWDGIKNIIPDLSNFLNYTKAYFTQIDVYEMFKNAYTLMLNPWAILIYLLKLVLVFGILLLVKRLIIPTTQFLIDYSQTSNAIVRGISLLFASFGQFVTTYFIPISLWIVLFCAVLFAEYDSYLFIFFYLFSIPYLLYLANRFLHFIANFNEQHEYPFLAQDFQRRFFFVFSFLAYSTLTIYLLREAYMLTHYYRSELPTILLALNFIIFQISLILLIDKEQILGLIPTSNEFWQWVHAQVDRFYYPILVLIITIIIMSNPYVGFGRLVLYILFGLLYSVVLFLGLYWLHGLFKRTASRLFFSSVDDVARERFSNAKTWFGITIIISFLMLSFFGLVIAARIWGWPITLSKIQELLYFPIIGGESKNPITMVSFLQIFVFLVIGFLIAYGLNKFVLDRIFDLLLVDPGVQHTVTSITQYIVIIAAVFLGFQSAKLGEIVNYIIGALILGLGLILKEPISDFVAYFIILVQRPIKIGDFIKIDNEITGVVRKITARSVILRRKNSTTIVVPNTTVISKAVVNWNYTRNFIAFDDIVVHVDYRENPELVRKLLYEILDEQPNILKNPKPWVRLDDFSDNGYEFMVRGFISSVYTLEKWEIASNVRIAIVKRFEKDGIELALPTRLLLSRSTVGLGKHDESKKNSKE